MKRMLATLVVILALSGNATAYADEATVPGGGTSEHVSHSVSTVTGAEGLTTAIQQVEGIELGSSSATVTLNIDGTETPMVVAFGDMLGGGEGGAGGGLVGYGALGVAAGVFLKLLRLFMRLGRA